MADRRQQVQADEAIREMMRRFMKFTDDALRDAARRGYRGKLFVWVEFGDLAAGGDVEMCWSETRPSEAPTERVYEYDLNDDRAARLLANTPPGGKADA